MSDVREPVELIACVTCGSAERETHGSTRGERLLAALRAAQQVAAPAAPITLSSVSCLWACSRSCAVHLRAQHKPGYVLCGFEPTAESARAILDWAALYAASDEGAVPFKQWPAGVRGHFLCRVPPAPRAAAAPPSVAAHATDLPPDSEVG